MKKVICTIMAMLALSTSASAAGNAKTFEDIGREMLLTQVRQTTTKTETKNSRNYDYYLHVFGVEIWHTYAYINKQ